MHDGKADSPKAYVLITCPISTRCMGLEKHKCIASKLFSSLCSLKVDSFFSLKKICVQFFLQIQYYRTNHPRLSRESVKTPTSPRSNSFSNPGSPSQPLNTSAAPASQKDEMQVDR